MKEKETADIQIRISKGTLEIIEKQGTYPDKNPEGILRRILPEYEILRATCPAGKPEEEVAAKVAESEAPDAKVEDADEKEEPEKK